MNGDMTVGVATAAERPSVLQLLRDAGLPPDGLDLHWNATLVARTAREVVGCAAVELYGADGLLRSVAVAARYRGTGVGQALTHAALALARARAVRRVYLLTETADGFFPRFGFRVLPRADLPASLQASAEMSGACPETAIAMVVGLAP